MAQAVSNRVRLSLIEEVTQGTTPASPALQILRVKSVGLKPNPKSVVSEELVTDRMQADLIFVGLDAGGDVGIEWIADAHFPIIEGAMMNDYVESPVRAGAAQITAVAAAAYTIVAGTFAIKDIISATGFALAANNGVFVAGTTTGTSLGTSGRAAETPGATARLKKIGVEGASADITATATGLASTTLNWTTMGLQPGQWVKIGGNSLANQFGDVSAATGNYLNNGYARVSTSVAITATALPLDIRPTGWAVDAGTGKTIRVYWTDFIKNGTVLKTYTFERYFADIGVYEYVRGTAIDMLALEAKPQSILTGSFTAVGMNYAIQNSAIASSTTVAANSSDVLNASSNVAQLAENGTAVGAPNYVFGLSFSIKNNVRLLTAVGSRVGVAVNYGTAEVNGKLEAYFGDKTLLDKVLNQTSTSLFSAFVDANAKGMLWDFPKVKFSGGGVDVGGLNDDLKQPLDFTALKYVPGLTAVNPYAISLSQFEGVGA